jgi:urea transport system permease protein
LGACIGAILINVIEATVSESKIFLETWQAIIGLLFVLVVLFLPGGLAGLANSIVDRLLGGDEKSKQAAGQEAPAGE